MTYTPDTPLEALAGIGPKKAQAFQKLGVATLRDLAGLYPRRYEDRTQFRTIADAQPGEAVCIRAAVAAEPRAQYVRSGLTLVKVRIADDTGALDVTYFNQPYRKNNLHAGETYIFYGKVEANGFRKTMTNPVCEQAARCGSVTSCFYPVYPLTTGVTQNDIRKAMTPALHACIGQLQDVIPADIARTYHLAQQDYALQNIHQPADAQALDTARKRLVFEELFLLAIGLKTTPPVMASLVSGIEPVLNPILVAVFYQEYMGPFALVGAAVVIVGVVGYNVIQARQTAKSHS